MRLGSLDLIFQRDCLTRVGGYFLAKNTKQLQVTYNAVPQNIIRTIVDANSTRKDFLADLIIEQKPNIVGVYRFVMKEGSDNFRLRFIKGIMKRIKSKGIADFVYEPFLTKPQFFKSYVVNDLSAFKNQADIILANRLTDELRDVGDKVSTRDIFEAD